MQIIIQIINVLICILRGVRERERKSILIISAKQSILLFVDVLGVRAYSFCIC